MYDTSRPWYWEGNIQLSLALYLQSLGWEIKEYADTKSRNQGKDVVAFKDDVGDCWITIKGYPEKSQYTQARHWFSQAIFDTILYRNENPEVRLGIGLPDGFKTYLNLIPRASWFLRQQNIRLYLINEKCSVNELFKY